MSRPLASSDRGAGPYIWRFTPLERILHAIVIVSFFGLVVTGTPLLFSHTAWAGFVIRLVGGFQAAGVFHRIFAVLTFGYFFTHVTLLTHSIITSTDRRSFFWGPDSMVLQPQDIRDLVQTTRWFFGKSPRARFDRFSYLDKLDYWGEFWGVTIIGGSGLVLWFPEVFARVLPGWAFNVATIVHGIEALLASGIIFTIHFFNVNLRPEKFPVDVSMFTGRATLDYLRRERPLEYERLVASGRLAQHEAPPPTRAAYLWSVTLGLTALGVGVLLIMLMLWAMLFGG